MSTSRLTSRRRQDQGFKWARIAIAVLSTVGVIDTGSITLNRFGWLGSLSCPGGAEGCDKVLNSPWGSLFRSSNGLEIPLSLIGLFAYLFVLLMAILPLLPGLSENKGHLSRQTWWGLFFATCGMSVFSLILIGLMVFKIEAFCFFCVLSAAISLALFALCLLGGGWDDPSQLIFRGILFSLAVLLGGLIWSSSVDPSRQGVSTSIEGIPPVVQNISTKAKVDLANPLTSSGAAQYSAYWCPHCHDQKEMFGKEAASKLRIVECAADGKNNERSLCERKGIEGFPTWEINGKLYSGVRSLLELSDLSGYTGDSNF